MLSAPTPVRAWCIAVRRAAPDRKSEALQNLKRTPTVGLILVRVERIAVGQTVLHSAAHRAGIHVEALGEDVVGRDRGRLQGAAAGAGCRGGAAGHGTGAVGVLVHVVIRRRQIQIRDDGVANACPEHVVDLVVDVGVVVDEGLHVAADVDEAGGQRRLRIRELDVLVAQEELERIEFVQAHDRIGGVVRDGGRTGNWSARTPSPAVPPPARRSRRRWKWRCRTSKRTRRPTGPRLPRR